MGTFSVLSILLSTVTVSGQSDNTVDNIHEIYCQPGEICLMSSEPNPLRRYGSIGDPSTFGKDFRCITEKDLEEVVEVRDYLDKNKRSFDWLHKTLTERNIPFDELIEEENPSMPAMPCEATKTELGTAYIPRGNLCDKYYTPLYDGLLYSKSMTDIDNESIPSECLPSYELECTPTSMRLYLAHAYTDYKNLDYNGTDTIQFNDTSAHCSTPAAFTNSAFKTKTKFVNANNEEIDVERIMYEFPLDETCGTKYQSTEQAWTYSNTVHRWIGDRIPYIDTQKIEFSCSYPTFYELDFVSQISTITTLNGDSQFTTNFTTYWDEERTQLVEGDTCEREDYFYHEINTSNKHENRQLFLSECYVQNYEGNVEDSAVGKTRVKIIDQGQVLPEYAEYAEVTQNRHIDTVQFQMQSLNIKDKTDKLYQFYLYCTVKFCDKDDAICLEQMSARRQLSRQHSAYNRKSHEISTATCATRDPQMRNRRSATSSPGDGHADSAVELDLGEEMVYSVGPFQVEERINSQPDNETPDYASSSAENLMTGMCLSAAALLML